MADDPELFEPDRRAGAPHPRTALHLFGQEAAEASLRDALNAGRLHHAWLLTGPQGIGKATLAWRIAKYLVANPPVPDDGPGLFGETPAPRTDTLDTDPDHPAVQRIMAEGEKALFVLRRGLTDQGRPATRIGIDEARKLRGFFALSLPDGGRRVVIVDSADEMSPQAANALLKSLEEPPRDTVFLIVCHQPARLLPTIRSRCRVLRLAPLGADDLGQALAQASGSAPEGAALDALTALSDGSPGAAITLMEAGGPALYARLVALMASLPGLDRALALQLAAAGADRRTPAAFEMTVQLTQTALARLARHGATGQPLPEAAQGEAAMHARLAPHPQAARAWAEAAGHLAATARRGQAVNLDPSTLLLDMFHGLQTTARSLPA